MEEAGLPHVPPPFPPAPLAGEVVDARTGEPVASARVAAASARELASGADDRGLPPAPRGAFTPVSTAGRFELHVGRRGTVVLAVHAPGYLPAIVPVGPRTAHVRVPLSRGGAIEGVVRDAAGAAQPGARVRAFCTDPLDVAEGDAGPDGRFALVGLRPGRWTIVVGDRAERCEVDVPEGLPVEVELRG